MAESTKRILVTGATGFVGSALCELLSQSGYSIRAALRDDRVVPAWINEKAVVGDISSKTEWMQALGGVDCVIHVAARAHVLHDTPASANLYTEANAYGTMRLAQAAASAGVRRLVYLSSIKVNGEETADHAYTAEDEPRPADAYAQSKWRGEQALLEVAAATRMETVVVRPPLVYGPGVRANFLKLLGWVHKELPLPLGAVRNKRSLVSLWNLCDLLINLSSNPAAPGRTWLVSDGHDLATPELIRMIATAMHRRARLIPVPVGLLRLGGRVLRRQAEIARLCGSLMVDVTATRDELGWSPPMSPREAISRTVDWYLSKDRLHVD